MNSTSKDERTNHPTMRITTLGDFAIERIARDHPLNGEEPRYEPVDRSEWSNRRPALTLLKVLLCRASRRAFRSELIEAIWPNHGEINADHALDSAASVLRRRILNGDGGGDLLLTLRNGSETVFKLAGQQRLWVDADAFLALEARALRVECQGQSPKLLLEEAHALARGEFLEDDLYASWAQPRRHTMNGARRRTLFKLADLYLKEERTGLAEEILFAALEEEPADEDALCRLMTLLAKQGRRQESLNLYQYTEDVLDGEQEEPSAYTRELARRIRQGQAVRERGNHRTAVKVKIFSLAKTNALPGDHSEGRGAQRDERNLAPDHSDGQMQKPYRYHPPRRPSRRQSALSAS